jgi:hypothetical protein
MTPENMHESAETKIKRLTKEIEEIDEFFYKKKDRYSMRQHARTKAGRHGTVCCFPAKCPSRFHRVFVTSTLMSFGLRNNIQLLNRIAWIAVLKGSPR